MLNRWLTTFGRLSEPEEVAYIRTSQAGPILYANAPSEVMVTVLPDITGLTSSVANIASQILLQTPTEPCHLIRKNTSAPALKNLDFNDLSCNAAYIRYLDTIYYVNKAKNIKMAVPRLDRKTLANFDRELATTRNYERANLLSDQELQQIILLTGHVHETKRAVYIYKDDKIYSNYYHTPYGKKALFDREAEIIAQQMEAKMPNGPYIIVAYSYSSLLAVEIMEYFKKSHKDCFVYIIDAPAPELAKKFLENKSPDPTRYENTNDYVDNILRIVNITADRCGYPNPLNLKPDQLERARHLPPAECTQYIADLLRQNPRFSQLSDDEQKGFDYHIKLSPLCLTKIMEYVKTFDKPLWRKIKVLLTHSTVDQYFQDNLGGWPGYADDVQIAGYKFDKESRRYVPDPGAPENPLRFMSHGDLVNADNAAGVAQSIVKFLEESITPAYLQQYNLSRRMEDQRCQSEIVTHSTAGIFSTLSRTGVRPVLSTSQSSMVCEPEPVIPPKPATGVNTPAQSPATDPRDNANTADFQYSPISVRCS